MKFLKTIKILSLVCALCVTFSFAACSQQDNKDKPETNVSDNSGTKIKGNRVIPNLSKVELRSASSKVTKCTSEEELIDALEAFANPNGNEFDAISILGTFRYNDDYNALRDRFFDATKEWQNVIVSKVGPKCVVDIELRDKTPVSLSDPKVAEWNSVNGVDAQEYTNVKCIVSTNYAAKTLTMSFDIVKLDDVWYLANTGTINKLQMVITSDIYR